MCEVSQESNVSLLNYLSWKLQTVKQHMEMKGKKEGKLESGTQITYKTNWTISGIDLFLLNKLVFLNKFCSG